MTWILVRWLSKQNWNWYWNVRFRI